MRKVDPLNAMAVGCVVIAGLVEAIQQALAGAPKVSDALPSVLVSPNLNYLPLTLISTAGLLWVIKHLRRDTPVSQFQQKPIGIGSIDSATTQEPERERSVTLVASADIEPQEAEIGRAHV